MRMVHTVNVLAVELQRFPSDVLNAATDACHRRLHPRGIHAVCVDPEEGYGSAAASDKRGRATRGAPGLVTVRAGAREIKG